MGGVARDGPAGHLTFALLGPVTVVDRCGLPVALGPPRRRALLAALLVHEGATLSVDRLVDLIWGADAPRTAATMVHGAVAGLRRVVEPGVLVTRNGGYTLDVRPEQVDAVRFERLLTDGRGLTPADPAMASQILAGALALWRGPALAGVEEPFARDAARRLDELRVDCVEERMEAELGLGRHLDVVADLEALAIEHPWRERLCAQLMIGLYRCGRQADALAAYRTLRRTLRSDLGLEPGPALRRLKESILRQDTDLELLPRRRTGSRPPARMPIPISTFVGRVREQDEVTTLLEGHRLVTLTGPGGSGKTRLAMEVARDLMRRERTDVWLVDLAPLTTPALVAETVAEALGVRAEPGVPISDTLGASLAARDAVILLDNCEHVIEACAVLVQAMLGSAGQLRMLATSREPLGVPGESVYPVLPLATADEDDGWGRIAACDAVRLFADRAADARRGFTVTEANAHLVLEICRRLDGLPLALELAAARVAAMPLRRLVSGLDDRFTLLGSATRSAIPRHRSLTAAVDWSYDLLDDPQRSLLCQLSVFPATFTPDAADGVLSHTGQGVGALLARLVTRSLVQLDDTGPEPGYRLLETTRQYGRERLHADALAGLRERHARWCLMRAEQALPHLLRSGSARWLARLYHDQADARAALEWSFGSAGDPEVGARLVGCLWHPWDLRGARGEGLHWVGAGLAAIGADRAQERMPLLSAGALFHLGRAEFGAVAVLAAEQLALATASGSRAWEGDALAMTATAAWACGDFPRALRLYPAAVAASLAGGDLWRASMEQAQLARLHLDRDEPAAARAVALRALGHARQVGEDLACGLVLDVLATLEHRWGEPAAARRLLDEARMHYRRVGYVEGEVSALNLAGRLAIEADDRGLARAAFGQSLDLCRQIGHRAGTASALDGLAGIASFDGDDEGAALLVGAASALRRGIGTPLPDAAAARQRQEIDRIAVRLGRLVAEQAMYRGSGMSIDALVTRAAGPRLGGG